MFSIERTHIANWICESRPVEKFTLSYSDGSDVNKFSIEVLSYGATIISVLAPTEVTLCPRGDNVTQLLQCTGYLGSIVGRYANRIALGRFTLDGQEYKVPVNNGVNALHGGLVGFDKRNWNCEASVIETTQAQEGRAVLSCRLKAVDGEEGYPGDLDIHVVYEIDAHKQLTIYYNVTTNKSTPINLTNHTYWNLTGGKATVHEHNLVLHCDSYLPVDATQIPTGELAEVHDTLFDLRSGRKLGDVIPFIDGCGKMGLDHCYVTDNAKVHDLNSDDLVSSYREGDYPNITLIAELSSHESGIAMKVHTTQPGVQVYTGNWLNDSEGFAQYGGICLETQHFPDAVNQAHFPSVILLPSKRYRHKTVFAFEKMK